MPHSISSVDTVLAKSQAKGAVRFLLTVIAHHMNAGGYAWPSVATLCVETGFGERYVHRLLKTLQHSHELDIQVGKGPSGANLYRLGGLLATPHERHGDDGVVYESTGVVYRSEDEGQEVVYAPPEGTASLEGKEGHAGSLAHERKRTETRRAYGWCEACRIFHQPGLCAQASA